jgi:hypothetical protein
MNLCKHQIDLEIQVCTICEWKTIKELKLERTYRKKITVLNSEIYSCLVCDSLCGFSALEEKLQVIFHICFNCITLFESDNLELALLQLKDF